MSKIESIKHKADKRAHIPSKEEAGMETANDQVKKKSVSEYPLNPVVQRGQDPELFWLNKYGNDNREELLKIDIRSLYRHEHISPEILINNLYKIKGGDMGQMDMFSIFGNTIKMDELDKVADYYKYSDDWKNRLIQGDSLLVMASLLEREGMAGKVQTIYIDPPYGIKYGSNWQMKLNSRDVKDGSDEHLTGEPEMVKAFRDTWELGIHSYLTFLRDRLLVAKELLSESGSCFVQISDENVHLVRNVMDEVFGSENFVRLISFRTTTGLGQKVLDKACDYIVWYSKSLESVKYRPLFEEKDFDSYKYLYSKIELENGQRLSIKDFEKRLGENISIRNIPKGAKIYTLTDLRSQSGNGATIQIGGKAYSIKSGSFKTNQAGVDNLESKKRLEVYGNSPKYIRYYNDFPYEAIDNIWGDQMSEQNKDYVVQTSTKVIERCVLMTTDPGDLVLDPTCGSGTTAYVAEQWGRRWITIDTSRIALNVAKSRIMTALFPFYSLYDEVNNDIRHGFHYKKVPHITLKNLANNEQAEEEVLYDQPITLPKDKGRIRVAGPFTVETLQNFEPISIDELSSDEIKSESIEQFEERVFEHLKSAGVKNGIKNENAVFKRVERRGSAYLHAEGFYNDLNGSERKAFIHIGPKFGTVSKQAVNEAVKECRATGDADWLIILGFSFEADISNQSVTTSAGSFEVTKVRMHDDLMQEGLLKKDKKAASFVTIGEPDIKPLRTEEEVRIEISGLDIYDPIKDEVKARSVADIAYWMVDDDYDNSNFIVKQLFFCGGDKDEFNKWKKGLGTLAKDSTKAKAQNTLKIQIDDEAFDRLYGFLSHPIPYKKGKKVAVKVISQFGEESMKVITL